MRVRRFSLIAVVLCVGVLALAQDRGSRGGGGGERSSSAGESRDTRSETASTSSYPTSVISNPSPSAPTSPNYGGSTYVPDYYTEWYYRQSLVENFLRTLWNQYPYFQYYTLQQQYSQGDTPLNSDVIRLVLQDSYEATNAIMRAVDQMSSLIDQREATQISLTDFQNSFDLATEDVRRLAKAIRKDARLEFLDQRRGVSLTDPPRARSIAELRQLVEQLRQATSEMRDGLETYYARDYTRTIDLEHLKQPSFKSMSNQIDKLAKTIGQSADRL